MHTSASASTSAAAPFEPVACAGASSTSSSPASSASPSGLVFLGLEHRRLRLGAEDPAWIRWLPGPPGASGRSSGCSPASSARLIIRKPGAAHLHRDARRGRLGARGQRSGAASSPCWRASSRASAPSSIFAPLPRTARGALPVAHARRGGRGARVGGINDLLLLVRPASKTPVFTVIYLISTVVSGARDRRRPVGWLARTRSRRDRRARPLRVRARGARPRLAPGSDDRAGRPVRRVLRRWRRRLGMATTPARRCLGGAGCLVPHRAGERVLLLGASGAGKSTLLARAGGPARRRRRGRGETGARCSSAGEPADRAAGSPGLVLQDPDSQVDPRAGRRRRGVRLREPRGARATRSRRGSTRRCEAVGLDVPRDRPTKVLSGGQKQRLALAGALAMRPGLLLLDEPTANLDPDGVDRGAATPSCARVDATGATLVVVEHRVDVWLPVDRPRDRARTPAPGASPTAPPAAVLGQPAAPGSPPRACGCPGIRPAAGARSTRWAVATGAAADRGARRRNAVRPAGPWRPGHRPCRRAKGRRLAITGPNGAGKSTLGLTLAGLLAPAVRRRRRRRLRSQPAPGPRPSRWTSRELLTPHRDGVPGSGASAPRQDRARRTGGRAARASVRTRARWPSGSTSCWSACGSSALAARQPLHAVRR